MKYQKTDIVILGGGAAGIATAVAAAKSGLKVIVVEKNFFLGGKATAAEVGTVCGLYTFSKKEMATYIVKGFAKDFAEELRTRSKSEPLHNALGLHYLPYNIPVFKNICLQLLNENGAQILFNAELVNAEVGANGIETVDIIVGGDKISIELKAIVDCSGHSIVSQVAGLPVIKSDTYQSAAQVFTLGGLKSEGLQEATLGMMLMKSLRSAVLDNKLPGHYEGIYIVPGSLREGNVSMKMTIPVPVTHTAENMTELTTCAQEMMVTATEFMIRELPVFHDASISHTAPEVGIRVGYRSKGKYVLEENDVLNGAKFEDAIANASWPIEEWEQDKRVKMRCLGPGDFYQVPAGCLQSETIPNLFFAGRNISATNGAIASARVMGICLQTGYAAGMLAAGHVRNIPGQEVIREIQAAQLLQLPPHPQVQNIENGTFVP